MSAGVAPNKFLAKIASEWNKPDGLFVVTPAQVEEFVKASRSSACTGLAGSPRKNWAAWAFRTCSDLRDWGGCLSFGSSELLASGSGAGRGIDERPVQVESRRQSVSVELTYDRDLPDLAACLERLPELLQQLSTRMARLDSGYRPASHS